MGRLLHRVEPVGDLLEDVAPTPRDDWLVRSRSVSATQRVRLTTVPPNRLDAGGLTQAIKVTQVSLPSVLDVTMLTRSVLLTFGSRKCNNSRNAGKAFSRSAACFS